MPENSPTPGLISDILLLDPFNLNNCVPEKYRQQLTVDKFFKDCYYVPNQEGQKEELNRLSNEADLEDEDINSPISQETMERAYAQQQQDEQQLLEWIQHNGKGIYRIVGNAGTGKSTYVRYLEYTQKDYHWVILDLAEATPSVCFIHKNLDIVSFEKLIGKMVSTLLRKISDILFDTYSATAENRDFQINQTRQTRIVYYLQQYTRQLTDYQRNELREEVSDIFSGLLKVDSTQDAAMFCRACGAVLYSYFRTYCEDSIFRTLDIALDFVLVLLYISGSTQKKILVFDNIERYIGADEIFDTYIVEVTEQLRGYSDAQRSSMPFYNFQIVLAMRNSTTRMFTPQQISDRLPNFIDISSWFSLRKIIEKKISWIKSNTTFFNENDSMKTITTRLNRILSDWGKCGNSIRGLNIMLEPLFNHNKRLMAGYLTEILAAPENRAALACAEAILDESCSKPALIALKKHAYRSIIWRLICDKLRKDNTYNAFARRHRGERDEKQRKELIAGDLRYARQILTILNNDDLQNPDDGLSFFELLRQLYPDHRANIVNYFFYDNVRASLWDKLSNVLFTFNMMSRHDNYWFQYLNIQCREDAINAQHIQNSSDFKQKLFCDVLERKRNNNEDIEDAIKIRITDTGKAFLLYVSHTFEQISSFYFDYPPLYTQVPSEEDLQSKLIGSLFCTRIIRAVSQKQRSICNDLREGNDGDILYYSQQYPNGISHWQRIENAYTGYVSNFVNYIELIYRDKPNVSDKVAELSKALLETCRKV